MAAGSALFADEQVVDQVAFHTIVQKGSSTFEKKGARRYALTPWKGPPAGRGPSIYGDVAIMA